MSSTFAPSARTYAHALLEASGGDAAAVLADLESLVRSIEGNPETWTALCAPTASADAQLKAVEAVSSGSTAQANNLLRVLIEHRRLDETPEIVRAFSELVAEQQGELDVDVTTAVEMDETLRSQIEKQLSASTGRDVRLHTSIDPDIVGGLVLSYGDTRLDASVRGRLDQLRLILQRTTATTTAGDDASATEE